MKKYLQKASRLFLWILGVIFSLILLSLILIQIPSIQNVAKEKVVAFIQEKIKTKVSIDRLKIAFPQTILLEGIYFEGQNKETLLAGKKMAVDISIWQLVNNKIILNSIDLNGIQATIKRDNKGTFNFDYIIEAFNSPQQQPTDSTAAPMVLRLNEINLDTIAIQYTDSYSKNNFALNLGHLDTKISTFDLDEMNFSVPKIKIKGLQLKLKQGISTVIPVPEKVDNTKSNLNIAIGEVDLSKIAIDYEDQKGKLTTTLALKKAFVKFEKTDIPNQFILIDRLALSDAEAAVALGKLKEIVTSSPAVTNESNNWEVKLRELSLKRIGLDYNNNAIAAVQKGMDYNHIKLSSLSTEAKFIRYNPISISGTINSFQVKEKSGLVIESFKSNFFYGRKNTFFKNLYLKTPQTEIKDEIQIGYQSIDNITTNLGDISIIAQLKKSRIGFKDILLLVPSLATTKPFDSNPDAVLLIDSKINGKLNAIKIPKLEVSGIGSTKINASGTITGLPDVAKAQFNLVLHELKTSAKDMNQWTPKGSIPNSIQLPAALQVSGIFKGTINDFYTDLVVGSSFGPAKIKAQFNQTIKTKEKYSVNANLLNFDLGKLLKNNELGKVSLQTTIKGTGLDPKTASTELNGTIQKLTYNKYTYQNIALQGGVRQGLFNVEGDSNDSNLTLDFISSGSFKDKYPTGTLQLNVDIADLEKLNLHAGPLKIRGVLTADIQSADIDYLNGSFTIKNLSVADDVNEFITDTIVVTALSNIDQNSLNFKSPFLNASLNGQYQLSKIGAALTASLSNYYSTTAHSKNKKTDGQAFDFKIGIIDSPLFAKLIPGIESLEPIAISGRYNSLNDNITINGNSPKLIYDGNTITNAVLQLDTKNGALVYTIMVDDFQNAQFQLPYVALTGTIANNSANYLLQIKDQKDQERYTLGGTVEATNGSNNIHFDPNTVLLNYEKWKIDADNLIQLGAKGFNIDKLALSKNNSSIEVQSTTNAQNAPIDIKVKDFKIETLSSVAEKSDLTISGNTNGTISLKNINSGAVFTTNLTIADFAYKKDTVGTIKIQVDNEIANNYRANIAITGQDNQVNLDGIYTTGDHTMDFNLDVVKLNLKSIQGFTLGNLTESTGFFNGKFSINGTATQPKLNGVLKWNEIGFKLKPLNATFKSMNDAVSFTDEAIVFNQFTIKDEKDNDLVIDGKINSSNLDNLGFDLRLDATNFQALNSTEKDNDLYYGKLFLDNHLRIKGSLNSPIVDGNIKVNKDTELSIVMPQSDPSIADREGIVEFIDQDHPSIVKKVTVTENLSKTEIKGINASVNIEVDKAAALSIIIDKANGDFLQLKGEADLNGGIDPSGKTTLTGRYELSEGAYEMNFNFIKRKFDIKNGSYILWTGEPTTADINITAVYKNEAAPIDLVDGQLGSLTTEARNTYKQKLPFETQLIMKGELMKPSISFDVVLPDGNNSVSTDIITTTQAKLAQLRQQPDELNKQVFALLLLNRFIGENPFASEAGGNALTTMARQSASKILSEQLNNLAGDLISSVQLNFDLNSTEDYTSGQLENKTNLNVGVTKKLLNDRLKVTVGSSFGLEGPQQTNENTNTIAGDVSVEYQLSKDGRYKLRAYRVNKYQVALQGQVVETGVAFIITLDYNHFKELFQKTKTPTAKKE
ncbi:translocation/assembly module TamB domain-containing protein [Flavobacterium muglaense]|uniref:Translocation/assembly module TamB n=1 Tax=Flavobacterium muglaense TaxID=2764716 RepID=A0A923SG23_9FLAO|nr:translocation/assembly module TamB domain-containing protein [Flavobacterium muglaense]MBC5838764.1 translocation/assembly module TamB [Flavobacterium muglaense]MBC5845277.1 translocation/assembly module TamB [Flavobacterium muglaense]